MRHGLRRTGMRLLATLFFVLAFLPQGLAQENGVMMQYFHWYLPNNQTLWTEVQNNAADLAAAGITAIWLPPAYKGQAGSSDVGYGVYDLYDLGEFNQKGGVPTKYGTKQQYVSAVAALQNAGISVYGDIVLNHKGGADATDNVLATRVDWGNRNNAHSGNVWIDAWTNFTFPGRGNVYSDFKWNHHHFDGVDWAQNLQENSIFRFTSKDWDWEVDTENANYDYLMFADIDFSNWDVIQELKDWGMWYINETGVDGFRIDAIKHIRYDFFADWLGHLRTQTGEELFTVGEFWSYDIGKLHNYINKSSGVMSLFDAPLHLNFHNASNSSGNYDMRQLMDNTLMKDQPALAVTLVDNHDTQPCQALESPVQDWFKPLAYAFILLREEGYPNVFYGDYYGMSYTDCGTINTMSHKATIDTLLAARRDYAYGPQISYMDHWDVIGWTRLGNAQNPDAMAVLLSDGPGGSKWMDTGKANTEFVDITGNQTQTITTNGDGWGNFTVAGGSHSVWVSGAGVDPDPDPDPDPTTTDVCFECYNGSTVWGQNVYVVGSIAELGNWNTSNAIKLDPSNYPTWTGTITVPANTNFEWKCIKKHNGNVVWQSGSNNSYTGGTGCTTGSF